jgi:hypothetical protein
MSTEQQMYQVNTQNTNKNTNSEYIIDNINMNLSDYTLDELFNLFDIKITSNTNYPDLVSQIETNASKYIDLFKNKNKKISEFFEKAKNILISSNDSGPKTNIIQYAHNYNPFSEGIRTENNGNMFNSNNGAGNPIHRQTVTKLFNIDSRFRENYSATSSTDFTIDLQNPQDKIIEIKLCDLELPTTYYPISTALGNNYMWVKYTATIPGANGSNDITNTYYIYIHIPDSNYYFSDLITYINGENCLAALNSSPLRILFDLNYNNGGGVGTGTGKVTFGLFNQQDIEASITFKNIQIEINFAGSALPIKETKRMTYEEMITIYGFDKYNEVNNINIQHTFGWLLGYRQKRYTNQLFYISESVMDIIGPRYLYLVINDGNDSNTNSNFFSASGSGLPSDTIARISLKGAAFSIQSQNDYSVYTEPRYFFGPVRISKIRVRLMDEYQRVIDLNNNDISFTLRMIVVYSAT